MKVAICDDELDDLKIIHEYLIRYDKSLHIMDFHSARELLDAYDITFYDLVFMDIEMEAPNGYEIATLLMQRQRKPIIIFITKSSEYTIQGYGVAFRYLPKPVTYQCVADATKLALKQIIPYKIVLPIGGAEKIFSVNDIVFFESFNHDIIVHTKTATQNFRYTLSKIISTLSGCHFAQPHKSYLVNLAFVDCIKQDQVQLTTGDSIRMSRDRKNQFCHLLRIYLRD